MKSEKRLNKNLEENNSFKKEPIDPANQFDNGIRLLRVIGQKEDQEEILNIYSLIPPPVPLTTTKYIPENIESQKIVITKIPPKVESTIPKHQIKKSIKEDEERLEPEQIEEINEDLQKGKATIEEVFSRNDIIALCLLEFKEMY